MIRPTLLSQVIAGLVAIFVATTSGSAEPQTQQGKWEAHWQKLKSKNPAKMFPSFQQFVSHPKQGLAFLRTKLHPVPSPNPKRLKRLVEELDDKDYAVRIKAEKALEKLGGVAEGVLRIALKKSPSREFQERASNLLKQLQPTNNPKGRQYWRALEILEYVGNKKAQLELKELAGGAKGYWKTREAKKCLRRIQEHPRRRPSGKAKMLHVLRGHSGSVYSVSFSPDGKLLASGSSDDTVRLWDIKTGKQKALLGRHTNVYSLCFSPDGKKLMSGGYRGKIILWDVQAKKKLAELNGHRSYIRDLVISPDGKILVSGGYDDTVKLWDLKKRKCVATLRGHRGNVYSLAFSPDGRTVASGSSDDTVRLWDVVERKEIALLKANLSNIYSLGFSPDGKTIIASDSSGRTQLWEVLTKKPKKQWYRNNGHRYFALRPDRRMIAFGGGGSVILRDPITNQFLGDLYGHTGIIRGLAFSPDGRILATGSYDNTIRIWTWTP